MLPSTGSLNLHATYPRQYLSEVLKVPLRQRVPVQAHQRRGGTEKTQRVPQVLR